MLPGGVNIKDHSARMGDANIEWEGCKNHFIPIRSASAVCCISPDKIIGTGKQIRHVARKPAGSGASGYMTVGNGGIGRNTPANAS